VSLLVTAVALAELCGAPEPGATRDPDDSAAYTAVGDEALAAGDTHIAAIAYRNAVALDPANERAAAALARLCKAPPPPDDGTALLDAIARYRTGERAAVGAALSAIVAARGPSASGAHLVLGLIALERHEAAAAIRELELARADPELGALASSLLRFARRDGALAITLLVAPELDTNPQLLPDTPPEGSVTGAPVVDEDLLTAATVTARPWRWLAIRDVVLWRNQRALSMLDFIGENAQVAAELVAGRERAALRYELDYDLLDGARYLFAHRAGFAYRHDADAFALVASYSVRRRDFARAAQQAFTGWVHAGDAGAVIHLRSGVDLDARLTAGRELTADRSFANLTGGVELTLRSRPTSSLRLVASAAGGLARYDAAQPDGQLRRDATIEASADLEVDLGDHLIGIAGASVARQDSSIEDFRYTKLIVRCGIMLAFGAL
jgi:hypothetical protein